MSANSKLDAPLHNNYPLTVLFMLLALCPDLFFSTAMPLLRMPIAHELHTSASAVQLGETFSNAGWAFGAVFASSHPTTSM